jgi:hypothetical protein
VSWGTYLRLGRVSNLPTVWTNVLAGTTLAGGAPFGRVALLAVAFSLFYTGGMYLNDAFDRAIDARERPERPIPSGRIGAARVFALGFGMLGAAVFGVAVVALTGPAGGGLLAVASGLVLTGVITLYDAWHKENPLSPVLMGLCRVLVYVTAALAVAGRVHGAVAGGAGVLLAYLVGLTYVAKQENLSRVAHLWPLVFLAAPFVYGLPTLGAGPLAAVLYLGFLAWVAYAVSLVARAPGRDIRRAVTSLIAGISLLDALLIVGAAGPAWAVWSMLGFILTLALQRWIPGT